MVTEEGVLKEKIILNEALADLIHVDALLALTKKKPKPNVPMETFLGNFKTDGLLSWKEMALRIVCPEEVIPIVPSYFF